MSPPISTASPKYDSAIANVTSSARRGTPPASAPGASARGRSPWTASDAPSFPNAARYALRTPSTTIPATAPTALGPIPGATASARVSSATGPAPAAAPSTPTVTTCSSR